TLNDEILAKQHTSGEFFPKENRFAETIGAGGRGDWVYRVLCVRSASGLLRTGLCPILGHLPLRWRDGRHRRRDCVRERFQFASSKEQHGAIGLGGPDLSLLAGWNF